MSRSQLDDCLMRHEGERKMEKKINDYVAGLLYGDSGVNFSKGYEQFFFSTTNKQVSDKVIEELDRLEIKYMYYQRDHRNYKGKEKYEILEIIDIINKDSLKSLKRNNIISDDVTKRIRDNKDFLRGYLETKGSLFQSESRGSEFWRISLSGSIEDVERVTYILESKLSIKMQNIIRRNERDNQGVISESHRVSTQSRDNVAKIIDFLDDEEVTDYLGQRIRRFKEFHRSTPFNMKRKVFKHYKGATGFMARELGVKINGIRNDVRPKNFKPVYLWNSEDVRVLTFNGWETAFLWASKEYEKKTGFKGPVVNEEVSR